MSAICQGQVRWTSTFHLSTASRMSDTIRIAVIGAGSAGIAQAKQAIDAFHSKQYLAKPASDRKQLELVVFEERDQVGGVWILDEDPSPPCLKFAKDGSRLYLQPELGENPTPMYPDLRTNLPKSIMSYRNTPWPEEVPTFPRPHQVHQYLQSYAKECGLLQYIRFKTRVNRVRLAHEAPLRPSRGDQPIRRWTVEFAQRDGTGDPEQEGFDFVSVATGHFSHPWIPDVAGLSNFTGEYQHSRWFRRASNYRGRSVLVVGSFASGYDVARMIAAQNYEHESGQLTPGEREHHTKVYQSSTRGDVKGPKPQPWDRYIDARPLISHIEPAGEKGGTGTVHFIDGTSVSDIDVIIYATGYYYSFPFLKEEDRPWNDPNFRVLDDTITPDEAPRRDAGGLKALSVNALDALFLFLEQDRTIAFIGLPSTIVPFPFFETQSHLTSLTWAGLLPNLPMSFKPPPNTSNPASEFYVPPTPEERPPSTVGDVVGSACTNHVRATLTLRKGLSFTPEYDAIYQDYILSLTREGDDGERGTWGKVEEWRKEIRRDTGLRLRILGY